MDIFLLTRLLTAHFLGDFIFQPDKWVKHRRQHKLFSVYLYLHAFVYTALFYLFSFRFNNIGIPLLVFTIHLLTDAWKSYSRDNGKNFIIDQSVHLVVVIAGWILYHESAVDIIKGLNTIINSQAAWTIVFLVILLTLPSGVLISILTRKWQQEIESDSANTGNQESGLRKAGFWIGYLERILVLTVILPGHFEAIGFLIAAKSIFRFSGSGSREKKQAEYILIGTMISFLIAILAGFIGRTLIIN